MNSTPPPETMKVLKPFAAGRSAARAWADRSSRRSGGLVPGCRAVPIQSVTIASNSSVVMPVWLAAMISHQPASPRGQDRLDVALEDALERLRRLPLGMLRSQRLDAIEREGELEVDRLLGPQRAVVVEDGDALGRRHEIRRAGLRRPRRRSRRSPSWRRRRSRTATDRRPLRQLVLRRPVRCTTSR